MSSHTGTGGSRSKFPFLMVPVSPNSEDIDGRTNTNTNINARLPIRNQFGDANGTNQNSSPSPGPFPPHLSSSSHSQEIQNKNPTLRKVNRKMLTRDNNYNSNDGNNRTTRIQKELNAQFTSDVVYPTLLQTFSAHDQLRRPARQLYPTSFSLSQLSSDKSDELDPNSILYNGRRITPENYRELLRSPTPSVIPAPPPPEGGIRKTSKTQGTSPTDPPEVKLSTINRKSKQNDNVTCPPLQVQIDSLVKQLRVKDVEILNLKNELSQVKKSIESSDGSSSNYCYRSLKKGLTRVEMQLEQLEEKVDLCDGDIVRKSLTIGSLPKKSYSDLDFSPVLFAPDFDRIIRSARELNSSVGNNPIELCYNSGGASFKQTESLALTMYKNGITLEGAAQKFKSFVSPATHQFIQDIYDGYFPSELQDKYPNGVTLIVEDKRLITFTKDGDCFAGKGKHLVSDSKQKLWMPKFKPGMKYKPVKHLVKFSDAEKVTSSESLSSSINSSSFEELPDLIPNHLVSFHHRNYATKNLIMITLKLKNMVTGSLYKFRTTTATTVEDILDYLEENLPDETGRSESDGEVGMNQKYELINILPFGTFSILRSTLKDYGIISNTLLYFRPS